MKRLLVLGAGTAGTMAVNKLRPRLARDEWKITVVDPSDTHYYQPGYLFVPFGIYRPDGTLERVGADGERVDPDVRALCAVGGAQNGSHVVGFEAGAAGRRLTAVIPAALIVSTAAAVVRAIEQGGGQREVIGNRDLDALRVDVRKRL